MDGIGIRIFHLASGALIFFHRVNGSELFIGSRDARN
jgi:hypothetical protein